jgi:hypothetical protein
MSSPDVLAPSPPSQPPAGAGADADSATATLDALVHGERRIVSFRLLSGVLRLPTTAAKAALRAYAREHPDGLAVLWAVTLGNGPPPSSSFCLTAAPYPGPDLLRGAPVRAKTVWAVARRDAAPPPGADELWTAEDRAREMQMVARPAEEVNELRDNRWSVFRSETAGWAGGSAESAPCSVKGDEKALPCPKEDGGLKKRSLSLVERVKVEDSEREKNRQTKRAKSGLLSVFTTKSKDQTASESHPPSRQPLSLAKSNRRASDAKPITTSRTLKHPARKVRRLDPDSDDENENGSVDNKNGFAGNEKKVHDNPQVEEETNDDDEEEVDSEAEALEREAAAQEEADRDRALLDQDSTIQDPLQLKSRVPLSGRASPVEGNRHDDVSIRETNPSEAVASTSGGATVKNFDHASGSDNASSPAVSGSSPLADTANRVSNIHTAGSMLNRGRFANGSTRRGTSRTVDETIMDDKGYIVTRRVTKYFDEDGNEIIDQPAAVAPNGDGDLEPSTSGSTADPTSSVPRVEPAGKQGSKSKTNRKAPSSEAPSTAGAKRQAQPETVGRPTSSGGRAKKDAKKPKGNIASYFSKK